MTVFTHLRKLRIVFFQSANLGIAGEQKFGVQQGQKLRNPKFSVWDSGGKRTCRFCAGMEEGSG